MNKLNYFFSFYFLLIILSPLRSDNHYTIDHLEPPFWWTGMSSNKLQLMVHGSDISELKPSISYPGISIHAIHQTSNSNYLFIDLIIDNDTKADLLELLKITSNTESHKYLIKSGIAKRFLTFQEKAQPLLEGISR